MTNVCSINDCGKPIEARGYCSSHYIRWWRHGDALGGSIRGDAQALIEQAMTHTGDDCLIWTMARNDKGYAQARIGGRMTIVSRHICKVIHGPAPSEIHEAAHSCGNRACVNPSHLRWATPAENAADKIRHGTNGGGYGEIVGTMLDALIHAEAILAYAQDFSTNKGGKGPSTNTRIARNKVRAAISAATEKNSRAAA